MRKRKAILSLLTQVFGGRKLTQPGSSFSPPLGLNLGMGCRVVGVPRVKVNADARINCGDGVILNSDPLSYHAGMPFPVTLIADRRSALIDIGERSRLHGCCVHAWKSVRIGKCCLLAAGCQILDGHGHASELRFARLRGRLPDVPKPVIVGDFCWMGLGSLVLKGAEIGEGCIVAPYSVVREGVYPEFSLLAGAPAKVVKSLPREQIVPEDYPLDTLLSDERPAFNW